MRHPVLTLTPRSRTVLKAALAELAQTTLARTDMTQSLDSMINAMNDDVKDVSLSFTITVNQAFLDFARALIAAYQVYPEPPQ